MNEKLSKIVIIAIILLNVFWCNETFAGNSYEYTTLPLYDLEESSQAIDIGINQRNYEAGYFESVSKDIKENTDLKNVSAEHLLVSYLNNILEGNVDESNKYFYELKNYNIGLNSYLINQMKDVNNFTIDRSWYFGEYQMFVVWINFQNREQKAINLGTVKIKDNFYRSDFWGRAKPISNMLAYIIGSFNKDLQYIHVSKANELQNSITISGLNYDGNEVENHPLTLYFNAEWYPLSENWSAVGSARDLSKINNFAKHIMWTAQNGTIDDFINLCTGNEKIALQQAYDSSPSYVEGLKGGFTFDEKIRAIVSMDLGEKQAYYYLSMSDPERVKFRFFKKANNRIWLSEIQQLNIEQFLTSDFVIKALIKKYLSQ